MSEVSLYRRILEALWRDQREPWPCEGVPQPTPNWSRGHFDMFLKVNSPRFVGELTPKVNSLLGI